MYGATSHVSIYPIRKEWYFIDLQGKTHRICGVCPYKLTIREKSLMLLRKAGALPGCGVMSATGETVAEVDDAEVGHGYDLHVKQVRA